MPIHAEVPSWEEPVHRFKYGRGELMKGVNGPVFTVWEALIHFDDSQFSYLRLGDSGAGSRPRRSPPHLARRSSGPLESTTTVRCKPVSTFRASTCAPGTTAPDSSVMTPVILAVDVCASAAETETSKIALVILIRPQSTNVNEYLA
jgi:hypothetical protein